MAGCTTPSGVSMALTGYVAAIAVGLVFVLDHRPFSLADGAISWTIAGRPGDRPDAQPLHRSRSGTTGSGWNGSGSG